MKKTLILMALLGTMTATAQAEEYWSAGVDKNDPDTMITQKKYLYEWHDGVQDLDMCGVVGAADVVAMWQEVVSKSGAVILPKNVPQRYDVWETMRLQWTDRTFAYLPMELWVSGKIREITPDKYMRDAGLAFKEKGVGYYPHLEGSGFITGKHDQYTVYKSVYGTMNPTTFSTYSAEVVDMMQDGWIFCFCAGEHVMTVYGVETGEVQVGDQTETGITKMWYSDNNYKWGDGVVHEATITAKPRKNSDGLYDMYSADFCVDPAYGNGVVNYFTGMRTQGLRFDTYSMTMTGADGEEDLFSHYLNLTVDGADYSLKYDLRNALAENSPVDSKGEKTGDISLKSGKLHLVDSTGASAEIDKGGSTEGVLSFDNAASPEATRTLVVERTSTIAKEIKIAAADGNTLEVTEGKTASFGKLTGEGNLLKAGAGTAAVTEALELKGTVDVQDGRFQLGAGATLSGETILLVGKKGAVENMTGNTAALVITSGEHTNDGVMTLTTTVKGGTLKGSGTFGMVTIDGGEMIVGNSPGHQEFTDTLTLSSGRLVFCAAGLDTPNDGNSVGWDSDTYSTINMNGHDFVIGPDGKIVIAMSADAANSLTTATGTLELTLATGLQSGAFSEEQLAALAQQTSFELSLEDGAGTKVPTALTAPNFSYKMLNNALVLTTGISGSAPTVPEPATGTLGLLALVALASRRRRK